MQKLRLSAKIIKSLPAYLSASSCYVFVNYLTFFISLITYVLYIKSLAPLEIGTIAISRTWGQLFDYLHLGTRFSIDRYSSIKGSSFSNVLLSLSIVSTIFLSIVVLATLIMTWEENFEFYSIILGGILLSVSNCFKAHFRARGNVKYLLINSFLLQLLPSSINLIIFIAAPEFQSLKFYCLPYIIFGIIFYSKFIDQLFFARFFLRLCCVYRRVVKHSSQQFIYSLVALLNITLDRFYVEKMLGREILGIYSVQLFILGALSFLPSMLSELKIREIMRGNGKNIILPSKSMLLFVGVPTLFALIVANLLIPEISNIYIILKNGIPGIYILMLSVVPLALTSLYSQTLSAIGKSQYLIAISCVLIFINIFLLFNSSVISENFTIAGSVIKLIISSIEAISLFLLSNLLFDKDKKFS